MRDRYPLTLLLLLTDLEQLGQTALQDFGRDVARTDGTDKGGLERHAQRLEAKLELYAVAATMAQREENLDGVTAKTTVLCTHDLRLGVSRSGSENCGHQRAGAENGGTFGQELAPSRRRLRHAGNSETRS